MDIVNYYYSLLTVHCKVFTVYCKVFTVHSGLVFLELHLEIGKEPLAPSSHYTILVQEIHYITFQFKIHFKLYYIALEY